MESDCANTSEHVSALEKALGDDTSPKHLPRVSISNRKTPSKRHQVAAKTQLDANMLDFLPELK